MKNWILRTTGALCPATLALITGAALADEYNTDKIDDIPRQAHHDLSLTCASRGLKSRNPSIRGIPENSRAAINAMGNNNIECSNIDLRATPALSCCTIPTWDALPRSEEFRPVHWHRLQSDSTLRKSSN